MPLSNASRATLPLPRMARGKDGSLLLSFMTLSFTTSRRFIPTNSRLKPAPHGQQSGNQIRSAWRRIQDLVVQGDYAGFAALSNAIGSLMPTPGPVGTSILPLLTLMAG